MLKFMQRQEKILLSVIMALILVLSAVIIIQRSRPEEEKVNNISVIVRDANDSFSKGVNQAAVDYNADVHITSGYGAGSAAQQGEYISREIDNGANALVVLAETTDFDVSAEGVRLGTVPMVAIRHSISRAACTVAPDNAEAGRMLGELAAERAEGFVCVICPETPERLSTERLTAAQETLDGSGVEYEVFFCNEDVGIAAALAGKKPCTLLVLDESMLAAACEKSRRDDIILGIGFDGSLRSQLETGKIAGLIVYSEYDVGYMCISSAVAAINEGSADDVRINLYVADSGNMYSDPIDKILFPIE